MTATWYQSEQAEKDLLLLQDQVDEGTKANLISSFERDNRVSYGARSEHLRLPSTMGFGAGVPVVGSAETVARKLAALASDNDLDALLLTFLDYVPDLQAFQNAVVPPLISDFAERGMVTSLRS